MFIHVLHILLCICRVGFASPTTAVYNDVVELLGDFGIKQEKLTLPEADNEMMFASSDEN